MRRLSLLPRFLAGTAATFSSGRRNGNGSRCAVGIGVQARVMKEEEGVVPPHESPRESELVEKLNGCPSNGNGAASTSSGGGGGGDATYSNGSAGYHAVERGRSAEGNGSLVKYVEGNGLAGAGASSSRLLKEVEVVEATKEGRKRRVEEIGKEDAWSSICRASSNDFTI